MGAVDLALQGMSDYERNVVREAVSIFYQQFDPVGGNGSVESAVRVAVLYAVREVAKDMY